VEKIPQSLCCLFLLHKKEIFKNLWILSEIPSFGTHFVNLRENRRKNVKATDVFRKLAEIEV